MSTPFYPCVAQSLAGHVLCVRVRLLILHDKTTKALAVRAFTRALNTTIRHHRKVQVGSEVLGTLLQERHDSVMSSFQDAPEIKECEDLRAQVSASLLALQRALLEILTARCIMPGLSVGPKGALGGNH